MKTECIGLQDERSAVAVVGVFDPFTEEHRNLTTHLAQYCRTTNQRPVAIILDPRPAALIQGSDHWPLFHDLGARMALFRSAGLHSFVKCELDTSDLESGAFEFIRTVKQVTSLAELWLGASQSLGIGERGSQATVCAVARDEGIEVRILPPSQWKGVGYRIIDCMRTTGAVDNAAGLAGVHPTFLGFRDPMFVQTNWPCGRYEALVFKQSDVKPTLIRVRMKSVHGVRGFDWPRGSDCTVFMSRLLNGKRQGVKEETGEAKY